MSYTDYDLFEAPLRKDLRTDSVAQFLAESKSQFDRYCSRSTTSAAKVPSAVAWRHLASIRHCEPARAVVWVWALLSFDDVCH
jgi:hypothetical protein